MKKAAIWNGHFDNLGDQLMMISIIKRLKKRYGDKLQILIPEKKKLGAEVLNQNCFFIYKYKKSLRQLHRWMWQRMSGVFFSDIDIIFDVNGYWLGDPWPAKNMEYINDKLARFKSESSLLILMPKTFGPFTNTRNVDTLRRIYEMADLVFSRDSESYNCLVQLFGNEPKHQLATDFTGSVTVNDHVGTEARASRPDTVSIIPNCRMVDKFGLSTGEYVNILQHVIDNSKKNSYQVRVVLQELDEDMDILRLLTGYDEMVMETNPLKTKQIIGQSRFVFSSRYHGVVNALSQGVPCLTFGWAHKYRHILEDYEVSDLLVEKKDMEHIIQKCQYVITEYDNLKIRTNKGAQKVKDRENRMWDEIFRLIDHKIIP